MLRPSPPQGVSATTAAEPGATISELAIDFSRPEVDVEEVDLVVTDRDAAGRIDDIGTVHDTPIRALDRERTEQNPKPKFARRSGERRNSGMILFAENGRDKRAADGRKAGEIFGQTDQLRAGGGGLARQPQRLLDVRPGFRCGAELDAGGLEYRHGLLLS